MSPRTPPGPPDLGVLVRAAIDGGDVLLVGRVQWRSEAETVVRRVRQVPAIARLRDRIVFHYDDGERPAGVPWRRSESRRRTR